MLAGTWAASLFVNHGLAALAFPLPLVQAGRSGGNLVLWGQVRPRSGVQTYRVQVNTSGAWRFSGRLRRTGAHGFFSTSIPTKASTRVRIFSPEDAAYSITIRAR